MATTQPIRSKNQIRELAGFFLQKGQIRNYVLIILGVHTALRISDLLRLTWDDVFDFERLCVRARVNVREKKTGKTKSIALNKVATKALSMFAALSARSGCFLIENPRNGRAISRIQAYRLIRAASEALRFNDRASCHSLRKTFGYHAWKNGTHPVVIMDIFNHSSLEVTRRYLGVSQDDKDDVYHKLAEVV